jgi:TPR repeat protein
MARGDVLAAWRFDKLGYELSERTAATAVGRTYDPSTQGIGVCGLQPDVEKARYWYERAQEQGDGEARLRLDPRRHEMNYPEIATAGRSLRATALKQDCEAARRLTPDRRRRRTAGLARISGSAASQIRHSARVKVGL